MGQHNYYILRTRLKSRNEFIRQYCNKKNVITKFICTKEFNECMSQYRYNEKTVDLEHCTVYTDGSLIDKNLEYGIVIPGILKEKGRIMDLNQMYMLLNYMPYTVHCVCVNKSRKRQITWKVVELVPKFTADEEGEEKDVVSKMLYDCMDISGKKTTILSTSSQNADPTRPVENDVRADAANTNIQKEQLEAMYTTYLSNILLLTKVTD